MNDIEWTKKAVKQLKKISRDDQSKVLIAVDDLAEWPDCRNIKNLVNREGYRLRVGRYRVLFTVVDGFTIVIKIEEVKKRDERTY